MADINGYYYSNNNGKIKSGRINNQNYEKIQKELLGSSEDIFDSLFRGTPLAILAEQAKPAPRYNKEDCDSDFPPSSKLIRSDKSVLIPVAATGCSEDDVTVELVGDKIHVQFHREPQEYDEVLYTQRGLRLPTDEELNFPFKPIYYDPSKITAEVKNGLLLITLVPRDEVKPVNRTLLGKKKGEKAEQE